MTRSALAPAACILVATNTPAQRTEMHGLLVDLRAEMTRALRTDLQCIAPLTAGGVPRAASIDAEDFTLYEVADRAAMIRRIEGVIGEADLDAAWLRRAIADPACLLRHDESDVGSDIIAAGGLTGEGAR